MNRKTKDMTMNALFIAITVVMALVPNLGMIHLGAVSITIMHIPVIVAGLVLGPKGAIINALAFGLSSLFISAIRPTMPLDVFFVNPLVSVLPRLLFGFTIVIINNLLEKITINYSLRAALTASLSTVAHTVFVLIPLYFLILKSGDVNLTSAMPASVLVFIWGTIVTNGFLEVVASVVIAVPITTALNRIKTS
ncbi:ECF transporter S component [Erysipelothrix urinaevulpis]|uniref:ECF transporter S component n=1 Tax=Erysipelothrix urinaevulpis TaxID=2683717 RepID=UPI0013574446|nr:ECF transporter S component [Erysipelothrix urinaevulpis]